MKRKLVLVLALLAIVGIAASFAQKSPLAGDKKETYYMITFLSGAEYWQGCFLGFQEAADQLGVTVKYTGTPEYDITKAVTVFDQVVAMKPAGIALACMNPEPFIEPINKAIKAGIKVVTFDTDSPNSNRGTYVSTDNYSAGVSAGKWAAQKIGGKGAVIYTLRPGQLNLEQRLAGFKAALEKYPDIKIVAKANGEGDTAKAATVVGQMLQAHPETNFMFCANGIEMIGAANAVKEANKKIPVLGFDMDNAILDQIKGDVAWATIAQDTWSMGFWSLMSMYTWKHSLLSPMTAWKSGGFAPLPQYIQTGVALVTKQNTQEFLMRPKKAADSWVK